MTSPLTDTVATKQDLGVLMARINEKRTKSRQFSNVTLAGALKDFGVKIVGLDKLLMTYGTSWKKQRSPGMTHPPPRRVVLSSHASSTDSSPEGTESSSTIGSEVGDPRYDHSEDTNNDLGSMDVLACAGGGHRLSLPPT